MKRLYLMTLLLFGAGASQATAITTLSVTDDQLTGATNVHVGATMYDVEFVNGSCNSLFAGCTQVAFTFLNKADALAASQALLDQVLINDPVGGLFDDLPYLTAGCENAIAPCNVITPYRDEFGDIPIYRGAFAVNQSGSGDDASSFVGSPAVDTVLDNTSVFALWQPSPPSTPVPEAATLALMGVGLAGLGFARRRSKGAVT